MSTTNNYNQLFANTNPLKLFFKASIPGAIGMLASNIYYLLESLLVGRMLGEDSFAAMNLALPLILINFAIADLVGVGSSVHLAIRLGERRKEEADKLFSLSVLLIFASTLVFSLVFYFFAPLFFHFMGADSAVSALATRYVRVYSIFTPITCYVFAFDNYLRICGKIQRSMFINIFMAVISGILEITFIWGFRLPLEYAALGTSIGMLITVIALVYPFAAGKMALKFRKPTFRLDLIKNIATAGSPTFLSNMAGRVVSILMNFLLLRIGGTDALSIYGILMNIDGFVLYFLYGMCDSLQPAVGYNYGAGSIKRVKAIERCCYTAAAIVSIAFGVAMLFFSKRFVSLFLGANMDSSFMGKASFAVIIFGINYFVRWISYATQSFFSAIGSSMMAVAVSVSSAFVFPLLSIAILWGLGVNGLYLNTTLTSILAAILSGILLIKVLYRLNKSNQ